MEDNEKRRSLLENSLKNIAKLIKSVSFYPPGHPTLKANLQEGSAAFAPLLASGELVFSVHKRGFLLDEKPVGPDNAQLQALATALFARRVQQVVILPDLAAADLMALARSLAEPLQKVQKAGGLQELLLRAQVTTIWFNDLDLAHIQQRREEIEAQARQQVEEPPPEPPPAAEQPPLDLAALLRELLAEPADARYRELVGQLPPLLEQNYTAEQLPQVLKGFSHLFKTATGRDIPAGRREAVRKTLDQLAAGPAIDFFCATLAAPMIRESHRELMQKILISYRARAAPAVMQALNASRDTAQRKTLAQVLTRQGKWALPTLRQALDDPTWYVVRNAVAILGQIRAPETLPQLIPLLSHGDLRVRREAVRSLTQIGTPEAVTALLKVVEGNDQELRLQAVLSLGALQATGALPLLLEVVQSSEPLKRSFDLKREAIKALGKIGDAEAVPTLTEILGQRRFWRRAMIDDLRAAAAEALGEIGGEEALDALERGTEDGSEKVARAANKALNRIRRGPSHGSGTE